jgi:uncharacterized protein (DUF302 family)
MPTTQVQVERFSVISSKPFEEVVAGIEAAVDHPDMKALWKDADSARTYPELENVIQKVVGRTGLMEFTRYDHGGILRKASGKKSPKILRLVVGNPLIMKKMVEHVPDAGSYAPVTILIDERGDGVHLSYDRMASFLSPYGNAEALKVAQDLDSKVEKLLTTAAGAA